MNNARLLRSDQKRVDDEGRVHDDLREQRMERRGKQMLHARFGGEAVL